MNDVDLAAYNTVHDFKKRAAGPRGAKALAPYVTVTAGVLNNKVDPASPNHHLNINESIAIQLATQDFRMLDAIARTLGHVCIRVEDDQIVSDMALLDLMLEHDVEHGLTAAAIREGFADGNLTSAEFAAIKEELWEDIKIKLKFLGRCETLVRDE